MRHSSGIRSRMDWRFFAAVSFQLLMIDRVSLDSDRGIGQGTPIAGQMLLTRRKAYYSAGEQLCILILICTRYLGLM